MSTAEKLHFLPDDGKVKTTKEKVENTYTDELILGICSPIGSIYKPIIDSISSLLKTKYNYQDVIVIKLSDFIVTYYKEVFEAKKGKTEGFSKLMHKINGGDSLRKQYHSNSILVELAIKRIREDRVHIDTQDIKGRRVCYIIDSIKNTEELQLLRAVYRDIFYLFSIFSPDKERISELSHKGLSAYESEEIIEMDDYESFDHGQNVRDTFVDGDFFIRSSSSNMKYLNEHIERYFNLIFNSSIIAPMQHETAMYYAKSAAGNSSCLSRQVGATITDKNGLPIVQGWNDVPKKGGNLYRDSDESPQRCKELGYCSNVTHKNDIIEEIVDQVNKVLSNNVKMNSGLHVYKPQQNNIADEINKIIRGSRFKNIIEYSRSIHAEMHAIIIGSQLTGDKMIDGDLYCTTYPCHNCARHIVLAGIKNIYYIEPYKKSLCLTLHNDSLTEDELDLSKVRILLYDGVAPRRYLEFFSMNNDNRKDATGRVISCDCSNVSPKSRLSLQAIPDLENQAIHALDRYGILDLNDE